MLTTNQESQPSVWQRIKNYSPSICGGLTIGGIGAFIACCAGPAAIGAGIGGGVAAGTGAIVGITIGSTLGGCVLGVVVNKGVRYCINCYRNQETIPDGKQDPSSRVGKPRACCSVFDSVNSHTALLIGENDYQNVQGRAGIEQKEGTGIVFHPSFTEAKHRTNSLTSGFSCCEEELHSEAVQQRKLS